MVKRTLGVVEKSPVVAVDRRRVGAVKEGVVRVRLPSPGFRVLLRVVDFEVAGVKVGVVGRGLDLGADQELAQLRALARVHLVYARDRADVQAAVRQSRHGIESPQTSGGSGC